MPSAKSEKNKHSAFTQILLIIVAFAIMSVSSFFFLSDIEKQHLINDSENALTVTETEITSILMEAETFLINYSETIRSMIYYNISENAVEEYIKYLTDYVFSDPAHIENLYNTHGYFFIWKGKYISGKDTKLPVDFNPQNQQWYKTAIAADGKIAISISQIDSVRNSILTFSRLIKGYNNSPLGIICIDIEMEKIFHIAATINLTENSYGLLLNNYIEIIAHPQLSLRGIKLSEINSGVAAFAPELERGLNINEKRVKNYMRDDSIVYFRKIKYDWYLGIIIPVHEYYKNVRNITAFLILIGSLLATALSIMFYYIFQAKLRSDIRTQQKSNFLATMSHEIRTPLNAILGMTEIQMQDTTHRPSTSEAFIKINNSGNLLLNIINDILDLSKIEAGKLELVPVKYDVAHLINDIIQLNYIRYESKPIDFILEIDENIPSTLVGDDLRIKQILNNILSNAFKYTDSGQVTFSINAECIGRGGVVLVTLVFQVKDTGQGMTPEQINKLFDEYTRFNIEANRTTEGAGLGMTITRNLINLMFGKINVKSTVGEGTTVSIRLPQKTDGIGIGGVLGKEMVNNLYQFKLGNSMQSKKLQFTHEYMPYGRILIVDDVETNLYVAKGLMTPYSLEIDLATSGYETIDKVKKGNIYDIIFMDHMMPKMDGIETTKQLRALGYKQPIVALTANALAGQAEVFLQNGFDGFISKPIDVRHLNITLNRLIRDKQSSEVIEAANKEKKEKNKKLNAEKIFSQVDQQLAVIFSRDAKKAADILEKCLKKNFKDEDDIHLYIINIHSMKSALANIGKTDLSATALRLEQAGRGKDINVMLTETQSFIDDLRITIEEIKPKNNITGEDMEDSLILLNEQLIIIKNACSSLDKKTAKSTLNKLMENSWSSKTTDLLNAIAEHLLHSEFDNAAAFIEKHIL